MALKYSNLHFLSFLFNFFSSSSLPLFYYLFYDKLKRALVIRLSRFVEGWARARVSSGLRTLKSGLGSKIAKPDNYRLKPWETRTAYVVGNILFIPSTRRISCISCLSHRLPHERDNMDSNFYDILNSCRGICERYQI